MEQANYLSGGLLDVNQANEMLTRKQVNSLISEIYDANRDLRITEECIFRQVIKDWRKRLKKYLFLISGIFLIIVAACVIFHCKLVQF